MLCYPSVSRKIVALKQQINFRKIVLLQEHVTEPSAKRGRAQGGQEDPVMQNPQLLVGKRVVHYFQEDGTRQGYFGVVIGVTLKHYTISRSFLNILREHTTKTQASGKVINASIGVTNGHVVLSRYANMEESSSGLDDGFQGDFHGRYDDSSKKPAFETFFEFADNSSLDNSERAHSSVTVPRKQLVEGGNRELSGQPQKEVTKKANEQLIESSSEEPGGKPQEEAAEEPNDEDARVKLKENLSEIFEELAKYVGMANKEIVEIAEMNKVLDLFFQGKRQAEGCSSERKVIRHNVEGGVLFVVYGYMKFSLQESFLQILDHNCHAFCELVEGRFKKVYSKCSKNWHVPVKGEKQYKYLDILLSNILKRHADDDKCIAGHVQVSATNLQSLAPTIAMRETPATKDLVEPKLSRFKSKK
ncbi:unnamed protein product, partial [Porites evermanni]